MLHPGSNELVTAQDFRMSSPADVLYRYLLDGHHIEPIEAYDRERLSIEPGEVLDRLRRGDTSWEDFVPPLVARTIKEKNLFGYES
jgi:hypothetical protein